MTDLNWPPESRDALLTALLEMPPGDYRGAFWTEDQRCWYGYLRDMHLALRELFQDYFAGRGARLEHWRQRDIDIEMLGALQSYYLALYALVQWQWEVLSKTPEVLDGCSTPGDVLIRCLQDNAIGALQPFLVPYFQHSPSRYRELDRLKVLALRGTATNKQGKRLDYLTREATRVYQGCNEFEQRLVSACEKLTTKRERKAQQLLKALRVAEGDLDRETQKGSQHRLGDGAYSIRDGTLYIS